jgi:hypothetical protein
MPTWLRCEDEHGNQFDLSPEDARVTGDVVKVLKDYPPNTGLTAVARLPKPRADKAGQPQTPPATPPADSTPAGTSANSRRSNSDG